MIELTNDFHNTRTRTRGGMLSPRRVREIRRELCGFDDCTCSGALGTRGRQTRPTTIEEQPDGSVWVELAREV